MEVPGPGIKPTPQQGQRQSLNPLRHQGTSFFCFLLFFFFFFSFDFFFSNTSFGNLETSLPCCAYLVGLP